MTKLIVLENPAQAARIARFAGPDWRVTHAPRGLRTLPGNTLGVAVGAGFALDFQVPFRHRPAAERLMQAAVGVEAVYLAARDALDAWHALAVMQPPAGVPIYRLRIDALTAKGWARALAEAHPLTSKVAESAQAQKAVDRLVGYLLTPLASRLLGTDVQVSRLGMAMLAALVRHETRLSAHGECFALNARLQAGGITFEATLQQVLGKPARLMNREAAEELAAKLTGAAFWVEQAGHEDLSRKALPPFDAANLILAAEMAWDWAPAKTLEVARILYEAGWITWPETHSTAVPEEEAEAARALVVARHGAKALPAAPRQYEGSAPAIRPTDLAHRPPLRDGLADGARLYDLIWRRFVAAFMNHSSLRHDLARIRCGKTAGAPLPLVWHAKGFRQGHDGSFQAYPEAAEAAPTLPDLAAGQALTVREVKVERVPPLRLSRGEVLAHFVEKGIADVNACTTALARLEADGLLALDDGGLKPTAHGLKLYETFVQPGGMVFQPDEMVAFQADCKRIATGEAAYPDVLRHFWQRFVPRLRAVRARLESRPARLITLTAAEKG